MKILGLLGVIVLIVFLILVFMAIMDGGRAIRHWLDQRRVREGRWEKSEISDGEQVTLYAICPGQDDLLVGSVAFSHPDFELKIEELRNEATYKVNALNSGRKELAR